MTTETRTHADAERTAGEDAGIDGDDALRTFVLFVAGTLAFSWGLWALPLLESFRRPRSVSSPESARVRPAR